MNKTFARQEFHFYTSLGSVTLFRTSLIAILIKTDLYSKNIS